MGESANRMLLKEGRSGTHLGRNGIGAWCVLSARLALLWEPRKKTFDNSAKINDKQRAAISPSEERLADMPTANAIATVNCTRCNGTGQYSGTRRDGTEYTGPCYGCTPDRRPYGTVRPPRWAVPASEANAAYRAGATISVNERGDLIAVPAGHTSRQPRADRNWHDFATRYPAEAAWLLSPASGDFGASLIKGCRRYGGLTPRQLAAVQRNVIVSPAPIPFPELTAEQIVTSPAHVAAINPPDVTASLQAQIRATGAAVVVLSQRPAPIIIEATRVRTAMDAAAASGLRKVRLVLGAITFKLSGASWRNGAGMILCYHNGAYKGWIDRENVFRAPGNAASYLAPEALSAFNLAASDPEAAARTYGRDHGRCACCQRVLTDPVSIMQSMGPICAQRYGWSR